MIPAKGMQIPRVQTSKSVSVSRTNTNWGWCHGATEGYRIPWQQGLAVTSGHQLHAGIRGTAHMQTLPGTEGYILPSQNKSIFGALRSAGIWQEIIVPHGAFTKHLL